MTKSEGRNERVRRKKARERFGLRVGSEARYRFAMARRADESQTTLESGVDDARLRPRISATALHDAGARLEYAGVTEKFSVAARSLFERPICAIQSFIGGDETVVLREPKVLCSICDVPATPKASRPDRQ